MGVENHPGSASWPESLPELLADQTIKGGLTVAALRYRGPNSLSIYEKVRPDFQ